MATTLGCRANSRKAGVNPPALHRLGRVPATAAKTPEIFPRAGLGAFAAVQTCADGNDFRDAGGLRPRENLLEILRVVGIIQMRMCVEENSHGIKA